MRRKSLFFAAVLVILSLALSGCSPTPEPQKPVRPVATPTARLTITPTVQPTATPTVTPEPIPDTLSMLNDYYLENEAEDEYQIQQPPMQEGIAGMYTIHLAHDEVPFANGTAVIHAEAGSSSIEIDFIYSDFYGSQLCAPRLIKAVSVATVKAIANAQHLDNADELAKAVIASYDETKYTHIVFVGDYAFSYKPTDTYAAVLNAVNCKEYKASFSDSEYDDATYDDMIIQLNYGSKYSFEATVRSYEDGQYRNTYASYKCLMCEVEMENGQFVNVVQFPEKAPIAFEVGKKYTFYGTTMFDTSGNLLFYLHYAE